MTKTTRRNLLKIAAAGGVTAAVGLSVKPQSEAQSPAAPEEAGSHGQHHRPISGPLAQATMSFGQWPTDPAPGLDRMRVANPGNRNVHVLVPNSVTIQASGTVNFIIAGFHNVLVYDNGTQPSDINAALAPPAPLAFLIDDPNKRIYRGLSPAGVPVNFFAPGVPAAAIAAPPQERIESVQFANPGTYLVICGVRGHFADGMYGFVTVLP